MKKTIFDYTDYREYLTAALGSGPRRGRGQRSRLAEALRCHTAYVSLVLGGKAELSLEQAELTNGFLAHGEEEAHFFLLLVQQARAGTETLRAYFRGQLREILDRRKVLRYRSEETRVLGREDHAIYYSSWHYAAIHIALSVPELRGREALARYFGLPLKRVSDVLDFLLSRGLATEESGRYRIGETSLHLESDAPLVVKHHTNWRMEAIAAQDREHPEKLHFSSVVSMAAADAPRVRALLIKAIEEARSLIRDSKEEEVFCYAVDLFPLRR